MLGVGVSEGLDQRRLVGHRQRRAIADEHRPAEGPVILADALAQRVGGASSQLDQRSDRQRRARLAPGRVGQRVGRADAAGNEIGHHRSDGVIGVKAAIDHRMHHHRRRQLSPPPRVAEFCGDSVDLTIGQLLLQRRQLNGRTESLL